MISQCPEAIAITFDSKLQRAMTKQQKECKIVVVGGKFVPVQEFT